ncbi:hypothetical protein J2W27_000787 [Variovorax boronicumulans]|uniref:hypothetical protein n=1 Tax=Variovorax TaxID=34072 RepID=UPI00163D4F48|nr:MULTISPECIES: hypothetical protein [Variovorax]MDP9908694.1 hypothetical protein [Variovorax boronicumulans]
MSNTTKKQKPPVALRLPDELQDFLTQEAAKGWRSLSREIVMRLNESRERQLAAQQPCK